MALPKASAGRLASAAPAARPPQVPPRPASGPRSPRRFDPVLLFLWAVFLLGMAVVSAALWLLISGTSG